MPDALQSALEKLRPANYPRIDKHHAAWYPSLPVLLTAWVARGSLSFHALQLFFAQFHSTLDMPPSSTTPSVRPPAESPIVDLTGAADPVIPALPPKAGNSALTKVMVSVNRETHHASGGVPPVLNGFSHEAQYGGRQESGRPCASPSLSHATGGVRCAQLPT